MTRGTAALAALLALLLAGHAAAQIFPYVPFWDIKPANNVDGIMRYRIWLNGRSYCFPDTRGYLVAPFCQKYVVGRPNTLSEAEQLAAASVPPSTRRLLASKKNATAKASSKPKKDKKKTEDAQPTDAERAIGAASYGGHDDWYDDDTGDWYFGNTGGFYSFVPRPLLNTWVTYDFGMWDFTATRLNPDGSAWGVPLDVQSVGRTNVCFDEFLTSAKFSDAAFMGAAGADRFVLENVDGFAWQLRLRSRAREIEGNPKMYLGASIWCKPFPGADFQDACLGFYDKKDLDAVTTWFLSPVNPCRLHNQTCANDAQCCGEPNMQCIGNFGSKICSRVPGPPGLSSVTQVYDDTKPGDLIFTVVLTAPASDGGSPVNKYELWATNEVGTKIGPVSSVSTTLVFTSEAQGQLCGHTWTFAAKAYNQVGGSPTARFTNEPFVANPCAGGCNTIGQACNNVNECCVNAPDRTGTVQCLQNICTQPPADPTVQSGPTAGTVGTDVTITVTIAPPNTYGLPVKQYCFDAYADEDFKEPVQACSDTNPTLVVSSQNPVNAAIMCTGSPITWKHMQVLVTTEAGTGISGTIQKDVTTAACVYTCQDLLEQCTITAQCCDSGPGIIRPITCADEICTQTADAPVVVSGPTGDTDGTHSRLSVTMNDPETYGLAVKQYWFTATNQADTTKVLSGYSDSDPTVLFSSEVAAFEPLLCTSAVITWGSMQIWVVTSAGEGEKTSITGTVTTPACTPNR